MNVGTVDDATERLTELLSLCHEDCDLFNSAFLGRSPFWSRQQEMVQSVNDYRITVAYTGNSVGKDFALGAVIPWWLLTRHESLVICTGPSQNVLGSVMWKEVRRATEPQPGRFPLGMDVSRGVRASPLKCTVRDDWQALGYSTTSVERASGQHNRKLLVIVEEASGVEDEIWDAIDSLKFARLFAIGNPIRPDGRFVSLIRQAESDRRDNVPKHRAVNAIRISSRESPHAHLEESPWGLADRTFIEDAERRHGKASLWVKVHIDAEIPTVAADTLIPEAWLDWAAAQVRPVLPANHPVHRTRRIACDLGEGVGRDSSCVLVRDDWGVLDIEAGAALGPAEASMLMFRMGQKWSVPQERMSYDRMGVGRDFPVHLARHGITRAVGYAGAASPLSSDFPNLRSECAWKLRQRLDPDYRPDPRSPHAARHDFSIPPGQFWQRLREELRVLTYELKGRQTAIMTKEDWATILGHSPDIADTLIQSMAF